MCVMMSTLYNPHLTDYKVSGIFGRGPAYQMHTHTHTKFIVILLHSTSYPLSRLDPQIVFILRYAPSMPIAHNGNTNFHLLLHSAGSVCAAAAAAAVLLKWGACYSFFSKKNHFVSHLALVWFISSWRCSFRSSCVCYLLLKVCFKKMKNSS